MKKFMYRVGCRIAHHWWVLWSNIRYKRSNKSNTELSDEFIINSKEDLNRIAVNAYKKFSYKEDGIKELYDSIIPPPTAYNEACNGVLSDDCDGFHSLMYYILSKQPNNLKCYLLSVCAFGSSHCVMLFNYNNEWYLCDYDKIYSGCKNIKESINRYNVQFVSRYCAKSEVLFNSLIEYDLIKNKFKLVKMSKV